jgi:phosphoribosyl-AMP cyclohydrolase
MSAASKEVEEGLALAPRFDADGLVTCVTTDAATGDVLMVAHMDREALTRTIATGEAWYYSRSRKALWKKGESSGHTQRVVEMRVDCDQDEGGGGLSHRAAFLFLSRHPASSTGSGSARASGRRENLQSV